MMLMASTAVLCLSLTVACEKKPNDSGKRGAEPVSTAPDLHLLFSRKDDKTYTELGKDAVDGEVVFFNLDESEPLEVTIESEKDKGIALCEKDQKVESFSVDIAKRESYEKKEYLRPGRKRLTICDDYNGTSLKYTARIGKSAPADPPVRLERKPVHPDPGPTIIIEPIIIIESDPPNP